MEQKMVEIMDGLPELLNQLGEKLGFAGVKLWEWSLLNVQISIINRIIWIALTVAILVIIILFHRHCKRKDINYDTTGYGVVLAFLITVFTIGAIGTVANLFAIPKLIINPEWHAFKSIMEQLAQLR